MGDDVVAVVGAFIDRINAHDPAGIVARGSADHRFTDGVGTALSGEEALERAWRAYFALFPDYRITIESLAHDGPLVLLAGWASASLHGKGASWRIPAAWRAVVCEGRVAEWQVYADNGPVRELLERADY